MSTTTADQARAATQVVNTQWDLQVDTVEQFVDRALPETGKLLVRLGIPVGCRFESSDHEAVLQ